MNCNEIISYLNEYLESYNYINVKGKTVLDIGADVGTSPFYFLTLGAEKVIAYATEQQAIKDKRIEWHNKWNGEYIKADVLKIDCEGCECMITEDIIEKYREWYIAIHTFSSCFESMRDYLVKHGKLVFTTPDKKEYLYGKCLIEL